MEFRFSCRWFEIHLAGDPGFVEVQLAKYEPLVQEVLNKVREELNSHPREGTLLSGPPSPGPKPQPAPPRPEPFAPRERPEPFRDRNEPHPREQQNRDQPNRDQPNRDQPNRDQPNRDPYGRDRRNRGRNQQWRKPNSGRDQYPKDAGRSPEPNNYERPPAPVEPMLFEPEPPAPGPEPSAADWFTAPGSPQPPDPGPPAAAPDSPPAPAPELLPPPGTKPYVPSEFISRRRAPSVRADEIVNLMDEKKPRTHHDRIMVFGYYMENQGGGSDFTIAEIKRCYRAVNQDPGVNIEQVINHASRSGFIVRTDEGRTVRFKLSSKGRGYVEDGLRLS
jgi:hypothetical protein